MKNALTVIILCLMMLLSACGVPQSDVSLNAASTPTATPADMGGSAQTQTPVDPSPSAAATQGQSSLYDPSIFIIEASGKWNEELAAGYYADYECEIYLHKIDANDNRQVSGSYEGVFWMKTTLDTEEFISDLIGDAPIDLSFDAGAEAVCDNLGVSLNTTDDKAWVNYTINDDNGNPLPLTQDTPVAKGSFVAVAKSLYLEAHGSGAQGENIDYSNNAGEGDLIDVNFVIHVAPDAQETGTQRKAVIWLSGDGFSVTLEGVMRRLPGYPEDVSDYLSSQDYQDSAWSHLAQ